MSENIKPGSFVLSKVSGLRYWFIGRTENGDLVLQHEGKEIEIIIPEYHDQWEPAPKTRTTYYRVIGNTNGAVEINTACNRNENVISDEWTDTLPNDEWLGPIQEHTTEVSDD